MKCDKEEYWLNCSNVRDRDPGFAFYNLYTAWRKAFLREGLPVATYWKDLEHYNLIAPAI